jgi:hypothetical protein
VLKIALLGVVALALVAQVFRPARTNPSFEAARTLQAQAHMPPQVAAILDRSCVDCHSNQTRWPWYSNVAPFSWFVAGHVHDARHHLNFSDWPAETKARDEGLMMMCNEVRKGFMPIGSYTWIHRGSKLSADDVKAICAWTDTERARLTPAHDAAMAPTAATVPPGS